MSQSTPYFSQSQLPSQQYLSRCTTKILSVEPIASTHPFHAEMKKLPKTNPKVYWNVQCDETVAFPLGGGQAADQGVLLLKSNTPDGTINIQYTIEGVYRINNLIYHVISTPKDIALDKVLISEYLDTVTVTIIIDMKRRLFNMHNHTTQHLISALFSQIFNFDTFGWTSGIYSPQQIHTLPFNPTIWEQIQTTLSCIDFTGDVTTTLSTLSLNRICTFLLSAIQQDVYPLSIFLTRFENIISIFIPTQSQRDELQLLLLPIESYEQLLTINFDILIHTEQYQTITNNFNFEELVFCVEKITNFIINTNQQVQVHIEGVIDSQPEQCDDKERSTTSMGSTNSTTDDADGMVIRQNVAKFSKYGQNGPVPKRFISIGIEKSPCCGTHVDSLQTLQFVNIYNGFRHGGRWRIIFAPAISSLPPTHWSYQLIDQLKGKLSCQTHEVGAFVDKNITLALSVKNYKTKIYTLLGQMLANKYQDLIKLDEFQTKPNNSIVLCYNDSFLTTPDDLNQICYAMSETLNAINITTRPIIILTTCDIDNLSQPAIFLFYGNESNANSIKSFGVTFGEVMGTKGGGRPGLYQGKLTNCMNYTNAMYKLRDNNVDWSFQFLSTLPQSSTNGGN